MNAWIETDNEMPEDLVSVLCADSNTINDHEYAVLYRHRGKWQLDEVVIDSSDCKLRAGFHVSFWKHIEAPSNG